MRRERHGPWEQVTFCTECPYVIAKEIKWMSDFFEPVCPGCGAPNGMWSGPFRSATARRVTTWWGKFVRTEFKDPERVARLRGVSDGGEDRP